MGLLKNRMYERVYVDSNLTDAWRKVRQGSDTAGSDGVTVAQFEARLFENLRRLQDDLRDRAYEPDPVRRYQMAKSGGRHRAIGVLTVRDRVAQRAVAQVIEPILDPTFEEFSFGYRPGRSAEMAVERLQQLVSQGHLWIVDLDIRDCFDRVDIRLTMKSLRKRLGDRALLGLIGAWLQQGAHSTERSGRLRRPRPKGLLQGSTLSPLLANVMLDRFDKWSHRAGLVTIRYADDIILACRDREAAGRALEAARARLRQLQFEVNADKTTILHAERGLRFLGHDLVARHRDPDLETEDDDLVEPADSERLDEEAELEVIGSDEGDAYGHALRD